MNKLKRRLKSLEIDEVSIVDRPAVKTFALAKSLDDLTENARSILETTLEAQDAPVQAQILKRLMLLDVKLDFALLNKAAAKFNERDPVGYAHCIRNPKDLIIDELPGGRFVITKKAEPIAERDGRVFKIDDLGKGVWVPKK